MYLKYLSYAVATIILPLAGAYFGKTFFHNMYICINCEGNQLNMKYFVLPARVRTPSPLPKVLDDDYYSPTKTPALFWGTYRYIGLL
jgi:hypothetical protein